MVVISEEYDPNRAEPITVRVVRVMAVASDREPTDLTPMGRLVSTEALDELITSTSISDPDTAVEVTFWYEGYQVDIEANGTVKQLVEAE